MTLETLDVMVAMCDDYAALGDFAGLELEHASLVEIAAYVQARAQAIRWRMHGSVEAALDYERSAQERLARLTRLVELSSKS